MPALEKKKELWLGQEEGSPIMCKALLSKDKGRSLEFDNLIPLGIRGLN